MTAIWYFNSMFFSFRSWLWDKKHDRGGAFYRRVIAPLRARFPDPARLHYDPILFLKSQNLWLRLKQADLDMVPMRGMGTCMLPMIPGDNGFLLDMRHPPRPGDLVVYRETFKGNLAKANFSCKRLLRIEPDGSAILFAENPPEMAKIPPDTAAEMKRVVAIMPNSQIEKMRRLGKGFKGQEASPAKNENAGASKNDRGPS